MSYYTTFEIEVTTENGSIDHYKEVVDICRNNNHGITFTLYEPVKYNCGYIMRARERANSGELEISNLFTELSEKFPNDFFSAYLYGEADEDISRVMATDGNCSIQYAKITFDELPDEFYENLEKFGIDERTTAWGS